MENQSPVTFFDGVSEAMCPYCHTANYVRAMGRDARCEHFVKLTFTDRLVAVFAKS